MKNDKLILKLIRKTNKNWQIFLLKEQRNLPFSFIICFFFFPLVYYAGEEGSAGHAQERKNGPSSPGAFSI